MLKFVAAQAYRIRRSIGSDFNSRYVLVADVMTTKDPNSGVVLGLWTVFGFTCYGVWDTARLVRKYPVEGTYESRRKRLKELDAYLHQRLTSEDKLARHVLHVMLCEPKSDKF